MTPDAAAPAVTTRATRGAGDESLRRRPSLDPIYGLTIILATIALLDSAQLRPMIGTMYIGVDAHDYWAAWHGGLYHGSGLLYVADAYLYSPAYAQTLYPLTLLDWPVFRTLWAIPATAAFAWMLRPLRMPYLIGLSVLAIFSVAAGSIEWMMCLVTVLGLRYPTLWAVAILTKVTPGVGILWFLARREWRQFGMAVGATVAIAGASFLVAPALWFDWFNLLYRNMTLPHYEGLVGYLPLRLAAAAIVVWISARRSVPEGLVLAGILATPDINVTTAALVAALPRIAERRSLRRERDHDERAAVRRRAVMSVDVQR